MAWERQANGPDWLDLERLAMEIERLHRCVCYVTLLPDGRLGVGCWRALVTITPEPLTVDGKRQPIAADAVFPNRDHKTMQGLLYRLLMAVDVQATQDWWEQSKLLA